MKPRHAAHCCIVPSNLQIDGFAVLATSVALRLASSRRFHGASVSRSRIFTRRLAEVITGKGVTPALPSIDARPGWRARAARSAPAFA
jgi:hypothetical protein